VRCGGRSGAAGLVELEVGSCLKRTVPGDDVPVVRVGAGALNGREVGEADRRADGGGGQECTAAGARVDKPFLMPIEDIFSISGRGTVVTGGSSAEGEGRARKWRSWVPGDAQDGGDGRGDVQEAAGRRAWRATTRVAVAGHAKEDVERGMVLAKPGSITPHTSSRRRLHADEGRRAATHAFFKGYRPQFYLRRRT
jgi:elongation factor Tu